MQSIDWKNFWILDIYFNLNLGAISNYKITFLVANSSNSCLEKITTDLLNLFLGQCSLERVPNLLEKLEDINMLIKKFW